MPSTTNFRPIGANAPSILQNKKGIAINAKKITVLKNISQSQSKRISGDTVGDKLPGGGGSLKSILGSIASSMDGIRDTLIAQNKVDSKSAEDERKAAEKAARGKQEKDLEGKFQGIRSVADKVLAPIKSIWETIVNFITTVFLGKLALKLFDWFANKENQDKVKAIGRFFKDWWPVLLAGYLLFGNALTAFVGGLIGKLVIWGGQLLLTVIPALVKALAKMKLGAMGGTLLGVGAIAGAIGFMGRKGEENLGEVTGDEGFTANTFGSGSAVPVNPSPDKNSPSGGRNPFEQMFNQGGQVPGSGVEDTVPAMLTPGEFVMSAPAVNQWGADTLESMNAMGGGTNMTMMDGEGTTFAAGGGLIGGIKNMVGGLFGGGKQSQEGSLTGLSESDYKDLAFIVSGEAQRGTSDEYGVAANVLNRVADPRYPNSIKEVGAEAGQYEAVFGGTAYDDPELAAKLASPAGQAGILSALQTLQGRTDFKGTSQYKNMGKGDIKFSPRGNFYHYAEQVGKTDPPPTQIPTHWKKFVGSGGAALGSQSKSTPRTGGTSANISAPPPVTSVKPPSKPKSTVAYAQQQGKNGGGKPAALAPTQDLPDIDASAMTSSAKIKVLGIAV